MDELRRRIRLTLALLLVLILAGAMGYRILTHGEAGWLDCIYMTVITVTTVGYGETIDLSNNPVGRVYTVFVVLAGYVGFLYVISNFTAIIVEGNLMNVFRRQKMIKSLEKLSKHYILCGCGETGIHILNEFLATGRSVVVVDSDLQRLGALQKEFHSKNFFWLEGDATNDECLIMAGIERARGLIACVSEDKENLLITLYARQLNEELRIISRCTDGKMMDKLKKTGADSVISPNLIGGLRMASEMVRPAVVSFLDIMLRDKDKNLRVEEIPVHAKSILIGKRLSEIDFWGTAALFPVAIQYAEGNWLYNPTPDTIIESECKLVIIGNNRQRESIEKIISSPLAYEI